MMTKVGRPRNRKKRRWPSLKKFEETGEANVRRHVKCEILREMPYYLAGCP